MPRYSTSAVARALAVNPRRITSAIERGLIPGERGHGTGNHRQLSREQVVQFALLQQLARLGVHHARAAVVAEKHHRAAGVLLVTPDDAQVQPREGFDVPAAALIIDLDTLQTDITERLTRAA